MRKWQNAVHLRRWNQFFRDTFVATSCHLLYPRQRQEFLSRGPKIQGVWMAAGSPTTLTKSPDLHDYHKCHRSKLWVQTPGARPPPNLVVSAFYCKNTSHPFQQVDVVVQLASTQTKRPTLIGFLFFSSFSLLLSVTFLCGSQLFSTQG